MQYIANGHCASGARVVSGASLAQILRNLEPPIRACWGADIKDGLAVVTAPTVKSIALTVGASSAYVFAALRLTPEQRKEVKRGTRPLIVPRKPAQPISPNLEMAWDSADHAELHSFANKHAGELLRLLDMVTTPTNTMTEAHELAA